MPIRVSAESISHMDALFFYLCNRGREEKKSQTECYLTTFLQHSTKSQFDPNIQFDPKTKKEISLNFQFEPQVHFGQKIQSDTNV